MMRSLAFIFALLVTSFLLLNCDTTSNNDEKKDDIQDGEIPVLELNGDDTIYMDTGEQYIELGCVAYDQKDGFLNDSIKIGYYKEDQISTIDSGSINDTIGICFVKYTVIDSDENSAFKWRCIFVGIKDTIIDTNITDTTIEDSTLYLIVNNVSSMKSGDTTTITFFLFKDSLLTELATNTKVNVYSNQSAWISNNSLTTNNHGSAYFEISYTLPSGVEEENISLQFYYNDQSTIASLTVSKEGIIITKKVMTISASPATIIADEISSSTISVKVKNEDFAPLVNEDILFASTEGSVESIKTTDSTGSASVKLVSSAKQCNAIVTATLKSDSSVTSTITIFFFDTTKASVGGVVEHMDGYLAPNVQAYLIPTSFNPVLDDIQEIATSITDQQGQFHFSAVNPGDYNIIVEDSSSKEAGSNKNITLKAKSGTYTMVSLSPYGTLILNLPDVLTENDYLYLPGTIYKWQVGNVSKTSNGGLVLPNLPKGRLTLIKTTSSFLPEITDTINIVSSDTTFVDIQ